MMSFTVSQWTANSHQLLLLLIFSIICRVKPAVGLVSGYWQWQMKGIPKTDIELISSISHCSCYCDVHATYEIVNVINCHCYFYCNCHSWAAVLYVELL